MSVLGSIVSTIFGHGPTGTQATPSAGNAAPRAGAPGPSAGSATASGSPSSRLDVEAILTKLASQNKEKLDWRRSIVDLMKLLKLDSSFAARKELAKELHYAGDTNDSAAMNVWLHKQVMIKLAENGGRVPEDLKR
jgi:hypothetical protein